MSEEPAFPRGRKSQDKSTVWSDDAIAGIERRRRDTTRRVSVIQLQLAELEQAHKCSSSVAMLRIREGRLKHETWEQLYGEYVAMVRGSA